MEPKISPKQHKKPELKESAHTMVSDIPGRGLHLRKNKSKANPQRCIFIFDRTLLKSIVNGIGHNNL